MQTPQFSAPDVQQGIESTNCRQSWKRKNKYLSLRHRWFTKSRRGEEQILDRAVRYKLYEMGYYAGAVILELGLSSADNASIAISGALDGKFPVQYYGVVQDNDKINSASSSLEKKGLSKHALLFQGSWSDFCTALPVTPTMVIVNCGQFEIDLELLSLIAVQGAPLFLLNHYRQAGQFELESLENYKFFGRFGDSALMRSSSLRTGEPALLEPDQFGKARNLVDVAGNGEASNAAMSPSVVSSLRALSKVHQPPVRCKWPYQKNRTSYPDTLPNGKPWPKISIITPSFNQGEFIEQTILSVANQGYPNVEHIVVDGDSTDQTKQVLERHSDLLTVAISEPDEGQSDAINKGFSHATGEIFTWLNSDDLLAEGALHAMAMAFHHSGADMVVGVCQMLQNERIVSEHLTSCQNGALEIEELLDLDQNWLTGRFFYQPELMFSRKLWERSGGYVDKNLYYSMDYDLWVRFAKAGATMHVIGRPIAIYRVHEQQKTFAVADYQPELRKVCEKYRIELGIPDPSIVSKPIYQPRNYRVAFVNDIGAKYGAGIAHARLQSAVESGGHETTLIAAKEGEQSKSVSTLMEEIESANPDLVMLGNLHGADLDGSFVSRVSDRWATCKVMHDLWSVTGRCAYFSSCTKFCSKCDEGCPTHEEYPSLEPENIAKAWTTKRDAFAREDGPVLLANSGWTGRAAKSSSIGRSGAAVRTVKYGFPTDQFKPRNRELCREILGLPQDQFIILFAACNVADRRKGISHLFEAMARLQLPNLTPVCFGYVPNGAFMYPGTISMGYVEDPWRSAMIYSAADVFVGPSQQEAFGQVYVEAAACGTPSVAYNVGGVSEAIAHGVSGLLAKTVHPAALAEAIYELYLDADLRSNLGLWGRLLVENEWSLRSAYHRLNGVLCEDPGRIGFVPPKKINFDPRKTGGIDGTSDSEQVGLFERFLGVVQFGAGFEQPEASSDALGIHKPFRWSSGKSSEIEVNVTDPNKNRVVLRCLNPLNNQTLTVRSNGRELAILNPRQTMDASNPNILEIACGLTEGKHRLVIECAKSFREESGNRELSFLALDVSLEGAKATVDVSAAA